MAEGGCRVVSDYRMSAERASAPDHTTSEISGKTLNISEDHRKIPETRPNIMRWSEVVLNKPQDWISWKAFIRDVG